MKLLGFDKDEDRSGSRIIYRLNDFGIVITVHEPDKTAKASTLRHVFDNFKLKRWFDNKENRKKFPFKKWGFNPKSLNYDTTEEDILNANNLYKNAEVYRVFYNIKSDLFILHTKKGYNLCRNENDRRPLLDIWYDDFKPGEIPMLVLENYETFEIELYPISPEGMLGEKIIMN
jgi:hypothetical protein